MGPGELIHTARRRAGMSQRELGARAGTSQPVISAYEHGRRDPTTGTLRRLVAATGQHLELRLAPEPPAIPPPTSATEHAQRLLDVLRFADAVGAPSQRTDLSFPRIAST